MKTNCTQLFVRYREITRLVWNLGFWPEATLREWDAVEVYREAMVRLFEGMVLLALGDATRVENKYEPGQAVEFEVEVLAPETELRVDKNPPGSAVRLWGMPGLRVRPGNQTLRFISFFDWNHLGPVDCSLLEVVIVRLDDQPHLVGRHALIELRLCSIWANYEEDSKATSAADQDGGG